MFGLRRSKQTLPIDHDDDILTFRDVQITREAYESYSGESVLVEGIAMRSDARNIDECWLPLRHIIVNQKTQGPRIITSISMPRWRAFHSAIREDAAHSVHRVENNS